MYGLPPIDYPCRMQAHIRFTLAPFLYSREFPGFGKDSMAAGSVHYPTARIERSDKDEISSRLDYMRGYLLHVPFSRYRRRRLRTRTSLGPSRRDPICRLRIPRDTQLLQQRRTPTSPPPPLLRLFFPLLLPLRRDNLPLPASRSRSDPSPPPPSSPPHADAAPSPGPSAAP